MKETLKSKKGITLIALVITIIILIILAGISISMLMGENGLITKAKQGTQNYQNASIEEQERLNTLYADFESGVVGTGSYDAIAQLINFKRTVAGAITDAGVATSEDDDAETMAANIGQAITTAQTAGHDAGYTEGQASAPGATLIGTYTGNQTIDVSSYLRDGDTADNFIVELVSVPVFWGNCNSGSTYVYGIIFGESVSKVLSENKLTISGCKIGVNTFKDGGSSGYGTNKETNITYKLWHV